MVVEGENEELAVAPPRNEDLLPNVAVEEEEVEVVGVAGDEIDQRRYEMFGIFV